MKKYWERFLDNLPCIKDYILILDPGLILLKSKLYKSQTQFIISFLFSSLFKIWTSIHSLTQLSQFNIQNSGISNFYTIFSSITKQRKYIKFLEFRFIISNFKYNTNTLTSIVITKTFHSPLFKSKT